MRARWCTLVEVRRTPMRARGHFIALRPRETLSVHVHKKNTQTHTHIFLPSLSLSLSLSRCLMCLPSGEGGMRKLCSPQAHASVRQKEGQPHEHRARVCSVAAAAAAVRTHCECKASRAPQLIIVPHFRHTGACDAACGGSRPAVQAEFRQ